jgi:hypothetical protein
MTATDRSRSSERRPTPIEALRAIRTADWLDRTVFAGCVVFAAGLLALASKTADGDRAAADGQPCPAPPA